MGYLQWKEEVVTDFSDRAVVSMYEHGFLFTRLGKGVMHQTRSCRIDLSRFELSSENRRILKKTEGVSFSAEPLPLKDYDFKLGKLAKDFYDMKFGRGTMSAQKMKEMLADPERSNFNMFLRYNIYVITTRPNGATPADQAPKEIGFAVCHANTELIHYSYPFYDMAASPRDMGLGMMIRAIQHAKEGGKKYVYLGSLQRPTDTYKLQFNGLEWFDGGDKGSGKWQTELEPLKRLLK